jgi:hypothetical protein
VSRTSLWPRAINTRRLVRAALTNRPMDLFSSLQCRYRTALDVMKGAERPLTLKFMPAAMAVRANAKAARSRGGGGKRKRKEKKHKSSADKRSKKRKRRHRSVSPERGGASSS